MEKLIRARERRKWTPYRAHKETGLSTSQIENLEQGRTEPTNVRLGTVVALFRAYPELALKDFGIKDFILKPKENSRGR